MTIVLPATVTVRPLAPGDRVALADLADACSARSLYLRFFSPVARIPAGHLEDVLACGPATDSVVAVVGGRVVGLATCHADGSAGELGVLVADAWQRRGIGRLLTAALAERARQRGLTTLVAVVLDEQAGLVRALRRAFPGRSRVFHEDETVVVELTP